MNTELIKELIQAYPEALWNAIPLANGIPYARRQEASEAFIETFGRLPDETIRNFIFEIKMN